MSPGESMSVLLAIYFLQKTKTLYRHLELSERYCIAAQHKNSTKATQFACDLGRDPSSNRRESLSGQPKWSSSGDSAT